MVITIARAACTERDRKHAAAVTAHNHRSDSGMWLFRQPHTSNANQTRLGVGRGGGLAVLITTQQNNPHAFISVLLLSK